jgi:hypothetical protein
VKKQTAKMISTTIEDKDVPSTTQMAEITNAKNAESLIYQPQH